MLELADNFRAPRSLSFRSLRSFCHNLPAMPGVRLSLIPQCPFLQQTTSLHLLMPIAVGRGNQLGVAGWAVVTDALEHVTSLTSLNGCCQYTAIRAGGLAELKLNETWELGVWAARFLERSASTLTTLDVRSLTTTTIFKQKEFNQPSSNVRRHLPVCE
jgi:hypothetical protein